jgi:predicted ATPase
VIEQIAVRNFKAFANCSAEFAPMTLILGENGIGKSTLVQAILLAKQAIEASADIPDKLYLNGPLVKLGNGFDALRQNADDEHIYVDLVIDGDPVSSEADYIAGSDVLPLRFTDTEGVGALRRTRVRYLSAERVGPQLIAPYSQSEASRSEVDEKGTNAFGLLHYSSNMTLDAADARVPQGVSSRGILALFNHYLGKVSSGAAVAVQDLSEIDSVSATFSFTGQSELPMEKIRSTNVGFGLSYVSSIIITCLIAEPGDLIIVENPEAHLHTKGQRAITDLLVRTASAGIQVICESHSREILYCARKKVIDKEVPPDAVSVLYVFLETDGTGNRRAAPWFPLTRAIGELGPVGENFLDYFGAPTDFMQNVVQA